MMHSSIQSANAFGFVNTLVYFPRHTFIHFSHEVESLQTKLLSHSQPRELNVISRILSSIISRDFISEPHHQIHLLLTISYFFTKQHQAPKGFPLLSFNSALDLELSNHFAACYS
ncbi:hypothetical protein LR48_Vigan07g229300 [Vigna angularis]|uniref:Uncharacterized protein n=1 Tax=Phaseolus angularis TaxID=3914 RepID=A0A0L9V1G5_PHAAN|nr:hypothetical protein LR48_Vigan07g229300 [Vigna angularis]